MTKPVHGGTDYQDEDGSWQDAHSGSASAGAPLGVNGLPVTQTLFFNQPNGAAALSYNEIHQGSLGDCWVLSGFGDQALMNPAAIPQMIHPLGNGYEAVTLYVTPNDQLPTLGSTSFAPINVLVNNADIPQIGVNGVDSISADVIGGTQAIWPQVLEAAFANLNGGYAAIGAGGDPAVALEELTGMPAVIVQPSRLSWAGLLADLNSDDLMVFNTASGTLPDGLISNHAYMLAGANANGTVQLANPWGFDQPAAISFSALQAVGVSSIAIGQQHQPASAAVPTV